MGLLNESELITLVEQTKGLLRDLQDLSREARRPAPGPYAFFHHCSHTLTRLQDVRRTTTRLMEGRARLTEIAFDERAAAEFSRISAHMRQDFETLYLFGQMLLDQWSHVALRVGGLTFTPGKAGPFVRLVRALESGNGGGVDRLWDELQEPILWLYWQLRLYRNIFIIHADRPWQRGTTAGATTGTFRLFTPSPIGWSDHREHENRVRALWDQAPGELKTGLSPGKDPRGVLLARLFENIGLINDRDLREDVGECFRDMGGATPTFQTVASKLLLFVRDGTQILLRVGAARTADIEL